MDSIFIITEGQSEEKFYKSVFSEYFKSDYYFQVTCMPNKKNAYSRKNKGGTVSYDLCLRNIKRFLNEATHCRNVFLIYDLYGLHNSFYDGYEGTNDTDSKISFLVNRLENDVNNSKFKFILQVHEFEAYLFADPNEIVKHFNKEEKLDEFNSILASHNNNPEDINDSTETAPSKRIINIFPQYEFGKTSDGVVIAKNIGIDKIKSKCKRFDDFCTILKN